MRKKISFIVEGTYDPVLWTPKGIKNDVRDLYHQYEGIKLKIVAKKRPKPFPRKGQIGNE